MWKKAWRHLGKKRTNEHSRLALLAQRRGVGSNVMRVAFVLCSVGYSNVAMATDLQIAAASL